MALSKKALQLKREKKTKKRKAKIAQITQPTIAYSNWLLYECWVPKQLFENGIGQVIISRRNQNGDIAAAMYLIDTYCLGLKNCFIHLMQLGEYQGMLTHCKNTGGEMELVDPVYVNTLIHKAIDYAQSLGFKAHEDFAKAQKMLKNISIDEKQEFMFGQDGLPFYIQGPNDSPAKVTKIMRILETTVGHGKYHYLIQTDGRPEF